MPLYVTIRASIHGTWSAILHSSGLTRGDLRFFVIWLFRCTGVLKWFLSYLMLTSQSEMAILVYDSDVRCSKCEKTKKPILSAKSSTMLSSNSLLYLRKSGAAFVGPFIDAFRLFFTPDIESLSVPLLQLNALLLHFQRMCCFSQICWDHCFFSQIR